MESQKPDSARTRSNAESENGPSRPGARPARGGKAPGKEIDFGELDDFVGFQLHKMRNIQVVSLAEIIAPESAPGHFPILYLIGRNPGSTQSAIAAAVGLDRSSLVPILNRFEASGWLLRVPAKTDRRAHALSLTAAGKSKLKELKEIVVSLETRISDELGDAGHRSIVDQLHRLQRAFGEG
jgi:DNA-binding MarR family transcriptional regulator